ncbi:hypothetical protein [Terrisporobacter sp.]
MNKKRILTSIGIVLFTTGVVGGIWSGINAMPKVVNKIEAARKEYDKEEVLYKKAIDLNKLDINSQVSSVRIKKYNGKEVIVEKNGNKDLSTITTKENNGKLTIKETSTRTKKSFNNINDVVRYGVEQIYKTQNSEMTVYVPEDIDINVNTSSERLYIEDIELNNLDYTTSNGSISLGLDTKIKNLNIKSNEDVSLQDREIYCAENVTIKSSSLNIYEGDFIKKDMSMPKNVQIETSSNGYDDYDYTNISISSTMPIAKNLDIKSNAIVNLELPLLNEKFYFDINTSKGIDFSDDNEKYRGTVLEKYFNYDEDDNYYEGEKTYKKKEFKGVINDNLKDDAAEYKVNVNSYMLRFN